MLRPLNLVALLLRRLAGRRDGNAMILFALAAIPVIIGAGIAIDTARAYMVKTRLGSALDAAALAVGSQSQNATTATLTTDLNNFFYDNYCKKVASGNTPQSCQNMVANEGAVSVSANTLITGSNVTYTASATVPTTFMRLVGVNNITVSVQSSTTKFPGMEIAVVLDNTGSMLCGPSDGAPNYSDSLCAGNVVTSDTNCTNSNNQSRICTLRAAALQFVTTLQNAFLSPQSIYMAIVPYVTTVNVGSNFCSNATTCSNITTDTACSGDFTIETTTTVGGTAEPTLLFNPNAGTSATEQGTTITISSAKTTSGSKTVTYSSFSGGTPAAGMPISGTNIPSGDTISAINTGTKTITLATAASGSNTGLTLKAIQGGATVTSGSPTVSFASGATFSFTSPTTQLAKGMIVTGTGIPANTAIQTVTGTASNPTSITLCNNATATGSNISLSFYNPITFDSTFNTTNATTTQWGGCVVEPTSSGENSAVSGVINSSTTNPDTTEPGGGWPSWYPLFWQPGSTNVATQNGTTNFWSGASNWTTASAQNTSSETQGTVVGTYDQLPGPNAGCPAPILPLTDLTTSAGRTAINNAIDAMWPKDSAGTQVGIGMIWGWRVLSSVGPFTANNGHPYTYSQAASEGWKKIIVLMTDGTEEWPETFEYTGLGSLSEGKVGTTASTTTAQSNLDTRLSTVCTNLKASTTNGQPNYTIYTIGLGSDGASNTTLQNCATKSTYFYSATPSNLQSVFSQIAASIIHLRLTQ